MSEADQSRSPRSFWIQVAAGVVMIEWLFLALAMYIMLPHMMELFADFDTELPFSTQVLLNYHNLIMASCVVFGVLVGCVGFMRLRGSDFMLVVAGLMGLIAWLEYNLVINLALVKLIQSVTG